MHSRPSRAGTASAAAAAIGEPTGARARVEVAVTGRRSRGSSSTAALSEPRGGYSTPMHEGSPDPRPLWDSHILRLVKQILRNAKQ